MPTELYQEPTPTERALEGEIDALLRVHIIMVRKLEDARLERDVANSTVKHLVATVRERDMELKDARAALDNAVKTNELLDATGSRRVAIAPLKRARPLQRTATPWYNGCSHKHTNRRAHDRRTGKGIPGRTDGIVSQARPGD